MAVRLARIYALNSAFLIVAVMGVSYLTLAVTLRNQLDAGLQTEIEEYGSLLETQDLEVLTDVLVREAASEGTDRVFFRVLDAEGREVVATDLSTWENVGIDRGALSAAFKGRIVVETVTYEALPHPVRVVYGQLSDNLAMQLGESTRGTAQTLQLFRRIFMSAILIFVCSAVALGLLMGRRAVGGVKQVTRAAREVSAGGWESRVPVSQKNDEIDELAGAFNEMVDRIQFLIRELREVTDDIAHDLRTPITRMRMMAESSMSAWNESNEEDSLAGSVLEECDRLLELINAMLEVSQTEAGARPLDCERVAISEIAEDVCELFSVPAEDKDLSFEFAGEDGLCVSGDPKRLRRALAHVLDNAVKYTEPGGRVMVNWTSVGPVAEIRVCDTGPGISADDLEKVFDRFYRVDKSRTEGGNGLGLSISRAILRAHRGDLVVESAVGKGSTFVLSMPVCVEKHGDT